MNHDLLTQYMVAMQFFSQVFLNSPEEKQLRNIAEEKLFEDFKEWECFTLSDTSSLSVFPELAPEHSIDALIKSYSNKESSGDYRERYLSVHMDHLALFSGPNPKSPPWESVWRERDRLLFGEQTKKVYGFFFDWGIEIEKVGSEPEDHLGLELAFVCFLLQTMQADPSRCSQKGITPQSALHSFMQEHLLPWAGDCLSKSSSEASTVFFSELPKLCWVMLNNLNTHISKLN